MDNETLLILALFSAFSLQATLSAQGGNEPSHGMEVRVQASPEQPVKPQAVEVTLPIIKPDAVKNQHIGKVISRFEDKGLRIAGIKIVKLNKEEAGQFYKAHRERPFSSPIWLNSCLPARSLSWYWKGTMPSLKTAKSWASQIPKKPLQALSPQI